MEFSPEEQAVISESICIDDAMMAKRIKTFSCGIPFGAALCLLAIASAVSGYPPGYGAKSFSVFGGLMAMLALGLCIRAHVRFQRAAYSVIRKLHRAYESCD